MSLQTLDQSINNTVSEAIAKVIPDAQIEVTGQGGHFSISVTAPFFEGLNMLKSQQAVLQSIKHLMAGANPPVHAIDKLITKAS